ncbi:hypothetical protein J6590_034824 [Homalodisca vitripennis]|nr:hypothetical protein J6590_034824 [Homalodisca vitripennis]
MSGIGVTNVTPEFLCIVKFGPRWRQGVAPVGEVVTVCPRPRNESRRDSTVGYKRSIFWCGCVHCQIRGTRVGVARAAPRHDAPSCYEHPTLSPKWRANIVSSPVLEPLSNECRAPGSPPQTVIRPTMDTPQSHGLYSSPIDVLCSTPYLLQHLYILIPFNNLRSGRDTTAPRLCTSSPQSHGLYSSPIDVLCSTPYLLQHLYILIPFNNLRSGRDTTAPRLCPSSPQSHGLYSSPIDVLCSTPYLLQHFYILIPFNNLRSDRDTTAPRLCTSSPQSHGLYSSPIDVLCSTPYLLQHLYILIPFNNLRSGRDTTAPRLCPSSPQPPPATIALRHERENLAFST